MGEPSPLQPALRTCPALGDSQLCFQAPNSEGGANADVQRLAALLAAPRQMLEEKRGYVTEMLTKESVPLFLLGEVDIVLPEY